MNRIIAYSFSALFIVVPLILTPWNYELFEFNKILAVYFFTVIITAAWAIRMILARKLILRRTPFDIPILLFLASQILSTIFSIDQRTSLLGYYSRFHGGLLSTMAYILLYYAFVSNLKKNHVLLAIRYMLLAAILVALYGVAEHFGIDKNLWVQDVQNRVFSTLGQPNWLAAYLITLIFIPISFARRRLANYALFALFYLTILYTKSRSGILGFALAYIIFWLALKVKPLKVWLLVTCLLLLVSFLDGLRWLPRPWAISYVPQATSSPAETQLASGGSESGDIRKIVWKGAIRIWRHYPLFGSGVETFAYSYYNFRPAEHNLVSEWDFLYNKAHNEYLNFLATTGIFGLGSYLLLQAWFVIWTLRRLQATSYVLIALLAGYIGLSVSNFFGFATVPVALLFWLYPAFAITLATPDSHKPQVTSYKTNASQKFFLIILSLVACFLLLVTFKWWFADAAFANAKKLADAGYVSQALPDFNKAITLMPKEPLFHDGLADTAAKIALALHQQAATASARQFQDLALAESKLALKLSPVNLNFWKTRIRVLFFLAQIDPNFYPQALDALRQAISLAPTDAKLYYNLGILEQELGYLATARLTLLKTLELKPDYAVARQALEQLVQ